MTVLFFIEQQSVPIALPCLDRSDHTIPFSLEIVKAERPVALISAGLSALLGFCLGRPTFVDQTF